MLAGVVAAAELVANPQVGNLGAGLFLGIADAAEGMREIPVQLEAAIVICNADVWNITRFSIPVETQLDTSVTPCFPSNEATARWPYAKPHGGSVR